MKQQFCGLHGLLGALVVLILLAAGMTPKSAQALTLINCSGEVELHYAPGLTNTTQTVSLTGEDRATLCLSLTHPTLHSFVGPYTSTGQLSCASLTSAAQGTETIYWNGNPNLTSSWTWSYSGVSVGGSIIATATGPITSGVVAGATLTQVVVTPVTALAACNQPGGLQTQTATSTWVFSN